MIRAVILAATIAALCCLWQDRPKPIASVQVDYCVITYPAAGKDPVTGELMFGWTRGYGPCSLQDEYRNI